MATTRTDRIDTPDGAFDAHLTVPDGGTGHGLVLVQEIFGINEYVEDVADRLAAEGYVVLAPDMFWRAAPGHRVASSDPSLIPQAMEVAGTYDPAVGIEDLGAAMAHLRSQPEVTGDVGIIGFCFGGTESFRAAIELDPACAVSYYGSGVAGLLDRVDDADCPMLFHFGADDPYLPVADAEAVRAATSDRDDVEVVIHEGAGHAFDNRFAPHFWDEAASAAAWQRTTAFLRRHLPAS